MAGRYDDSQDDDISLVQSKPTRVVKSADQFRSLNPRTRPSPGSRPIKHTYGTKPRISGGYMPRSTLMEHNSPSNAKRAIFSPSKTPEDLFPEKTPPPSSTSRFSESRSDNNERKPTQLPKPRKRKEVTASPRFQIDQINTTIQSNSSSGNTAPRPGRLLSGSDRLMGRSNGMLNPSESSSAKRRRRDGFHKTSDTQVQKFTLPRTRTLHASKFILGDKEHFEAGMDLVISWQTDDRTKPRVWELSSTNKAKFRCLESEIDSTNYCSQTGELLVRFKARCKASIGNQIGFAPAVVFALKGGSESTAQLANDFNIMGRYLRLNEIDQQNIYHEKLAMKEDASKPEFYSKPMQPKTRAIQREPVTSTPPPPPTSRFEAMQPNSFYSKKEETPPRTMAKATRTAATAPPAYTEKSNTDEWQNNNIINNSHGDDNKANNDDPDDVSMKEATPKKPVASPKQKIVEVDNSPPASSQKRKTRAQTTPTKKSESDFAVSEEKKRKDHEQFRSPFTFRFHDNKSVTITPDDYNRLDDGEFLNDTMVNFYMKFLKQRAGERKLSVEQCTYVFNTFFFEKLMQKNADGSSGFENVKKWTTKIDLFKMKYIIIPINWRMHWYVVVVYNLPSALKHAINNTDDEASSSSELESCKDAPIPVPVKIGGNDQSSSPNKKPSLDDSPIMFVLDSLRTIGSSNSASVRALKDFFVAEAWDKKGIKLSRDIFRGINPSVPQQPNYCDCGIYILHYVERFLNDPEKFARSMIDKSPEAKASLNILWKSDHLHNKRDILRNTLLTWMYEQLKESQRTLGKHSSSPSSNVASPHGNENTTNNGITTTESSRHASPNDSSSTNNNSLSGRVDNLTLSEDLEKEHHGNEPENGNDDEDMVILDFKPLKGRS